MVNQLIKGLRITVSTVLRLFSDCESIPDILDAYPQLEEKDILVCLEYACRINDKTIFSELLEFYSCALIFYIIYYCRFR